MEKHRMLKGTERFEIAGNSVKTTLDTLSTSNSRNWYQFKFDAYYNVNDGTMKMADRRGGYPKAIDIDKLKRDLNQDESIAQSIPPPFIMNNLPQRLLIDSTTLASYFLYELNIRQLDLNFSLESFVLASQRVGVKTFDGTVEDLCTKLELISDDELDVSPVGNNVYGGNFIIPLFFQDRNWWFKAQKYTSASSDETLITKAESNKILTMLCDKFFENEDPTVTSMKYTMQAGSLDRNLEVYLPGNLTYSYASTAELDVTAATNIALGINALYPGRLTATSVGAVVTVTSTARNDIWLTPQMLNIYVSGATGSVFSYPLSLGNITSYGERIFPVGPRILSFNISRGSYRCDLQCHPLGSHQSNQFLEAMGEYINQEHQGRDFYRE